MSAASSVAAAHTHMLQWRSHHGSSVVFPLNRPSSLLLPLPRLLISPPSITVYDTDGCSNRSASAKSPHMSVFEQLISVSVCSARSRVRRTGLGNRLSPQLTRREKNSKGGAARDDTATGRPPDTPASLGPPRPLLVFVPAPCPHVISVTQIRD